MDQGVFSVSAGYKGRALDCRGWAIPNALDPASYDPETGRRYLVMHVRECLTAKTADCIGYTSATSETGHVPACPNCGRDLEGRRPSYRQYFEQDDAMPEPTPEPVEEAQTELLAVEAAPVPQALPAEKVRKLAKRARAAIARAARIERDGLRSIEVACNVCGAQPRRGANGHRDPGYCRRPGGRDPLPHHGTHKARDEFARQEFARIVAEGLRARQELDALQEAVPVPAPVPAPPEARQAAVELALF